MNWNSRSGDLKVNRENGTHARFPAKMFFFFFFFFLSFFLFFDEWFDECFFGTGIAFMLLARRWTVTEAEREREIATLRYS